MGLPAQVNGAGGATRFANGDWRDLGLAMPVIDAMVREVGDVATVASSFVELCERAVEHYPVETFAAQTLTILKRQSGTPAGWGRSGIPGRLAGLVQEFAEHARPLSPTLKMDLLRILDLLVDMGDRRAAALQASELFRDAHLPVGPGR